MGVPGKSNAWDALMDQLQFVDKNAWKKYLFYVDMLVWGILIIAIAYVVGNIYLVGYYEGNSADNHETSWWRAFMALGFAVGSLAWVFFRFWKNGFMAVRRPF